MTEEIEILYESYVGGPEPRHWPEYLKGDPVKAHGLYSFYSGLRLGLQLAAAAFYPEGEL